MPTAPNRVCARCRQPAPAGKRCACRPAWEGSTHPGNDGRWKKLRAAKLVSDPVCQRQDCRHPATDVDHIIPNAEDPTLRYEWSNLESLCRQHHSEKTRDDARRGKARPR